MEAKELRKGGKGEGGTKFMYQWMAAIERIVGSSTTEGATRGATAVNERKAKKCTRLNISKQWRGLVQDVWAVGDSEAVTMITAVAKMALKAQMEMWKIRCNIVHEKGEREEAKRKRDEEVEEALKACEKRWQKGD